VNTSKGLWPVTRSRSIFWRSGDASALTARPRASLFRSNTSSPGPEAALKRVSNLTVACEDCNQSKNNLTAAEFGHPNIQKQALRPLKDAAAVNATRYAIGAALKTLWLPISFWSGGRTKFNRTQQCYPKAHWIDATCVGESGNSSQA